MPYSRRKGELFDVKQDLISFIIQILPWIAGLAD